LNFRSDLCNRFVVPQNFGSQAYIHGNTCACYWDRTEYYFLFRITDLESYNSDRNNLWQRFFLEIIFIETALFQDNI